VNKVTISKETGLEIAKIINKALLDHLVEGLYGWVIYHPDSNQVQETNSYFMAMLKAEEGWEIIGKV